MRKAANVQLELFPAEHVAGVPSQSPRAALPKKREISSRPSPTVATQESAADNGRLLPRRLVGIVEAGRLLGVGRSTMYELIAARDLEVVHIGRAARVPVDAVDAYVERIRAVERSRRGR